MAKQYKYFNRDAFFDAVNLIKVNPVGASLQFEAYTKKYPTDCRSRLYYALSLTILGMFDEAECVYNELKVLLKKQQFDVKDSFVNTPLFFKNMLAVEIKILASRNDYQGILDLIHKNKNRELLSAANDDLNYIEYYCEQQLGILNYAKVDSPAYRFSQTIDYSEERFLDHIKKHLYGNTEEQSDLIFDKDFPLDKVITEIKKNIPSNERTYPGFLNNAYYFKYDNCGIADGEETNYLCVVTFHDTDKIISMYPKKKPMNIPFVDLNYLKEEKTKKLSQIDKFNKRFNRN